MFAPELPKEKSKITSASLHCCSWSSLIRRSHSNSSSIPELTPEGENRERGSRTPGEISQKHITMEEWSTRSLIPQHCSCHRSSGSGLVIVEKKNPEHNSKPSWSLAVPRQPWQEFSPRHCCPGIWQDVPSAVLSQQQITSCSAGQTGRGRDSAGRTLQAAACKSQQLEAEANYFKNREGSRRSTCEDQDKVTDRSKHFHL